MDYEGQKLSELLFHWIILSFGAVGWIVGYFYQDFSYVFYAWSVGTLISIVVRSLVYFPSSALSIAVVVAPSQVVDPFGTRWGRRMGGGLCTTKG